MAKQLEKLRKEVEKLKHKSEERAEMRRLKAQRLILKHPKTVGAITKGSEYATKSGKALYKAGEYLTRPTEKNKGMWSKKKPRLTYMGYEKKRTPREDSLDYLYNIGSGYYKSKPKSIRHKRKKTSQPSMTMPSAPAGYQMILIPQHQQQIKKKRHKRRMVRRPEDAVGYLMRV